MVLVSLYKTLEEENFATAGRPLADLVLTAPDGDAADAVTAVHSGRPIADC